MITKGFMCRGVNKKYSDNSYEYTGIDLETNKTFPLFVKIKLTEDSEPIELHNVESIIVSQEEDCNVVTYHYISRSDCKIHTFRAIDFLWYTIMAED